MHVATCCYIHVATIHVATYMLLHTTYMLLHTTNMLLHTCCYIHVGTYMLVHTCWYIHTYIRTYVHTYIRTYIHTYIHATSFYIKWCSIHMIVHVHTYILYIHVHKCTYTEGCGAGWLHTYMYIHTMHCCVVAMTTSWLLHCTCKPKQTTQHEHEWAEQEW